MPKDCGHDTAGRREAEMISHLKREEDRIMTSTKKRIGTQFLCGLMIMLLFLGASATPAQAALPKIKAQATVSNTMKLLKAYDPDGYFMVNKAKSYGSSPAAWIGAGDTVVDSINTIVHEECHANMYLGVTTPNTMTVYKGNGKYVSVKITDNVFRTKKIASSIPKRLRTFRYGT